MFNDKVKVGSRSRRYVLFKSQKWSNWNVVYVRSHHAVVVNGLAVITSTDFVSTIWLSGVPFTSVRSSVISTSLDDSWDSWLWGLESLSVVSWLDVSVVSGLDSSGCVGVGSGCVCSGSVVCSSSVFVSVVSFLSVSFSVSWALSGK